MYGQDFLAELGDERRGAAGWEMFGDLQADGKTDPTEKAVSFRQSGEDKVRELETGTSPWPCPGSRRSGASKEV